MRFKKTICLLLLLLGVARSGLAFSLLTPLLPWQVTAIGYNLPGDIGGPATLNEGYRWNIPVLTYAFDESFIRYFGTNGMKAVNDAFKILSDIPPANEITLLTNISGFFGPSTTNIDFVINGEKVPTDPYGPPNLPAAEAGLLDLKSHVLSLMLEQLGLAEPERWTWALRGRALFTAGGVTYTNYTTIQRNYDPITLRPTNAVNGKLYGYQIFDPIPQINYADAIEYAKDPNDPFTFTSVAGGFLGAGQYYQRLTRDDVGGLRFLFNTNNIVTETLINSGNSTITRGTAVAGSGQSPWTIYLGFTNLFLSGTNVLFATNLLSTNLIVQGLRPGMNKIYFTNVYYDSLLGQSFVPITNYYTDTTISNATIVVQPLQRRIQQPDILFTAEDLGLAANLVPVQQRRTGTGAWQNNDAINGRAAQGGPGVITPPIRLSFTDQFPYYSNISPSFLDDLSDVSALRSAIWGSFDGTTNAPIIYPEGYPLTLEEIRNRIFGGPRN